MPNEYSSLFAFAADMNKPEPRFKVGDLIYLVRIDKVFVCKIKHVYECKDSDNVFKEYGYHLESINDEYKSTTWDHEIGFKVFVSEASAREKAYDNAQKINVFSFSKDQIVESRAFTLTDDFLDHQLTAFYCLLKNNTVVYRDERCYAFAKVFENEKDAERYFNRCIGAALQRQKDINSNYGRNVHDFLDIPFQENMIPRLYECTRGYYSELGYFEHNYAKEELFNG